MFICFTRERCGMSSINKRTPGEWRPLKKIKIKKSPKKSPWPDFRADGEILRRVPVVSGRVRFRRPVLSFRRKSEDLLIDGVLDEEVAQVDLLRDDDDLSRLAGRGAVVVQVDARTDAWFKRVTFLMGGLSRPKSDTHFTELTGQQKVKAAPF